MIDLLAADFGIRQLHARYIDALWRQDAPALARCFDEAGEWHIAGQVFRGRAEIAAGFAGFIAPQHSVLMRIGTPLLDIGDGTATGRVLVTEDVKKRDGGSARHIGVYEDRYAGEGVLWRFVSRRWTTAYRGPVDLSEPYFL